MFLSYADVGEGGGRIYCCAVGKPCLIGIYDSRTRFLGFLHGWRILEFLLRMKRISAYSAGRCLFGQPG